ncbi:MAG: DUF2163 domain-containing protein [Pikeienuella sp.]
MRAIPENMAVNLAAGATTHCRCWKVVPARGDPLGFTDHDCDLVFEDVTFEASSGFEASNVERSIGLSIDNATAQGVLQSDRMSDEQISRGDFDGAEVFQWIVDWQDPTQRVLIFRGEIGEIRRGHSAFEVELRGLAEKLNRPNCRRILHVCDASFGDQRCGANATMPEFAGSGTVVEANGRDLIVNGLNSFEDNWFSGGRLEWTTGPLTGETVRIAMHQALSVSASLTLMSDPVSSVQSGEQFVVTVGCDKSYETCRDRFDNLDNFRGFPFVPGENWVTAFPNDGGTHDGGSLLNG